MPRKPHAEKRGRMSPTARAGMPRDLGGAPGVDAADHAADYRVLPTIVRVRWRGVRGDAQIALALTLSNDKNEP